jgi:hypothetical protein
MTRIPQVSVLTLIVAAGCWLSSAGCSSSNDPSGNPPASGAGAATVPPAAGAGNTTAQGGGTSSSAGTGTDSGGSTTIAGTSGSVAGGTSVAGATGTGGDFMPLCTAVPLTAAGVAPTKAGACVAADSQLCYKTCGPLSSGFKSETCMNGAYVEQSGCSFPPTLDASCFKIPTAIDASCPTTIPQASQPCTVAQCTLCNVGGNYSDSTGASKAGYCVCPAPGASGTSKWSCASTTAWPCPMGQGC